MKFYYLPESHAADEHGALGVCISSLLSLIRATSEGPTDLFSALAIVDRVFNGQGQGGESVSLWEIARWKDRATTEAGLLDGDFEGDDFLAWVGEDSSFHPKWHVYGEAEFRRIFEQACRNYVAENPKLRVDLSIALTANGMSLED